MYIVHKLSHDDLIQDPVVKVPLLSGCLLARKERYADVLVAFFVRFMRICCIMPSEMTPL